MSMQQLQDVVIEALEDLKGMDIRVLDVREATSFTDIMVIASGGSTRQVKALANSVIEKSKAHGCSPLGIEGAEFGEWVLVDLGDIVVHVMLPQVRDFYNLEKLWGMDAGRAE